MKVELLNWKMSIQYLTELFRKVLEQSGVINIYTTLIHTSRDSNTKYISAFVILDNELIYVAREVKMRGMGLNLGLVLAQELVDACLGGSIMKFKQHWVC